MLTQVKEESIDLDIEAVLADREMCRRSLRYAHSGCWSQMEPGTVFTANYASDLICEYLQLVYTQEIKRLIINIPPRMGKSTLTVGSFPAWVWLTRPEIQFMFVTYSLGLTRTNFAKTKLILESDWHRLRRLTEFDFIDNTKTNVKNSLGGHQVCQAWSKATGLGCNIQIVDDLHSATDARSDRIRQSQIEAYETSLASRLNNPQQDARIVIMQRLHGNDLTAYLMREIGGYTLIDVPFEAEESTSIIFPLSGKVWRREEGSYLSPERFSESWIAEQKRTPVRWFTQYQQRPPEGEGSVFFSEWFTQMSPHGKDADYFLISVDPAGSVEDSSSHWAIGVYRVESTRSLYTNQVEKMEAKLIDVVRSRFTYPDGKNELLRLYRYYKQIAPVEFLIENKSTGVALIPDLANSGIPKATIHGVNPKGSKEARAIGATGFIAGGAITYDKDADWWPDFWLEVKVFPRSQYNDQVDQLVQAADWLKEKRNFKPAKKTTVSVWSR